MHSILREQENPHLREHAHPVRREDIGSARLAGIIADMQRLLAAEEHGVALAAPQVGESIRLFIVSGRALAAAQDESAAPLPDQIYINPKLVKMSKTKTNKHEGCLSIKGYWGMVPRAEKATVRAFDERGRAFTRGASGFLAHIFQHELDHLDGILYTDKAVEFYKEEKEATDLA